MAEKLLPCPFCGGKAKLSSYRTSEDSEGCSVHCKQCEVRTTEFEDAYAPTGNAADAWNRRATTDPTPETSLAGSEIEAEIARVVQSVNEWDDRTSPDEYPEHLLITSEELSDILRNFADTLGGRNNG